jgi:hypothetical protein
VLPFRVQGAGLKRAFKQRLDADICQISAFPCNIVWLQDLGWAALFKLSSSATGAAATAQLAAAS